MRKKPFTNTQTVFFIIAVSTVCALVLSILASMLSIPKEEAKTLDRSQQLLMAAKMFSHEGYFLVSQNGSWTPAELLQNGKLEPTPKPKKATKSEVLEVVSSRVVPMLVNDKGEMTTYEQAGLSINQYLSEHKKSGFKGQAWYPIYEVFQNSVQGAPQQTPLCYVIPISGFGLWDYIFGFIAIKPDGVTVQGISWYEHKETPGLGANISEPDWQKQFPGKVIFQPDGEGKIDLERAPIGLTVVRGKVSDIFGSTPRSQSAVDGMAGATLTGNGVTKAYKDTLELYRPFFERLHSNDSVKIQ